MSLDPADSATFSEDPKMEAFKHGDMIIEQYRNSLIQHAEKDFVGKTDYQGSGSTTHPLIRKLPGQQSEPTESWKTFHTLLESYLGFRSAHEGITKCCEWIEGEYRSVLRESGMSPEEIETTMRGFNSYRRAHMKDQFEGFFESFEKVESSVKDAYSSFDIEGLPVKPPLTCSEDVVVPVEPAMPFDVAEALWLFRNKPTKEDLMSILENADTATEEIHDKIQVSLKNYCRGMETLGKQRKEVPVLVAFSKTYDNLNGRILSSGTEASSEA